MATDAEITAVLQLLNSPRIGAVSFYKLLDQYGSASEAIGHIKSLKSQSWAEDEIAKAQKLGVELVYQQDPEYPQRLKTLEAAPPLLYARGDLSLMNSPLSLAIVGARNATINGRKTASRIAHDLSYKGVTIISGMARGIDAAAHKGAMFAKDQQGPTVAILGTGADVPYPEENRDLYIQIVNQGLVLSEFPLGTLPNANNFPRRNKIVAALSQAVLVVEATFKSGSLITAQLAEDYGRRVLAVPGSPTEARAEGPNRLIKDGAALVENAEDIITILNDLPGLATPSQPQRKKLRQTELFVAAPALQTDNPPLSKIIDYLNHDGVYVDEIIRVSGWSPDAVALELLKLEMSGKICRMPGNRVALIK